MFEVTVRVKAPCIFGEDGKKFDGLVCDPDRWCGYFSDYFSREVEGYGQFISKGVMSFKYDEEDQTLYVVTDYVSNRVLSTQERENLITYTQGQWSDGMGESFEQEFFDEEKGIKNPSPWYLGQVAKFVYVS